MAPRGGHLFFTGFNRGKGPPTAVADLGFPAGGEMPSHWGRQPLMWALLAKIYAKMKELDPVGGACRWHPLIRQCTGSATDLDRLFTSYKTRICLNSSLGVELLSYVCPQYIALTHRPA